MFEIVLSILSQGHVHDNYSTRHWLMAWYVPPNLHPFSFHFTPCILADPIQYTLRYHAYLCPRVIQCIVYILSLPKAQLYEFRFLPNPYFIHLQCIYSQSGYLPYLFTPLLGLLPSLVGPGEGGFGWIILLAEEQTSEQFCLSSYFVMYSLVCG